MIDTVGSLGYGKKLGKYGFSERLCSNKEQCEEYLDFCKKNKMVWLGRSYGTLVHKKFSNHFDWLGGRHKESDIQIELKVMDDNYHFLVDLNHSNVTLTNDGKFKNNGRRLKFGLEEVETIYAYKDYPLNRLSELTQLSMKTLTSTYQLNSILWLILKQKL